MSGKSDARPHARTQADADAMAAKWAATFGESHGDTMYWSNPPEVYPGTEGLTRAERDAMWRAGTHIQRGRDK